MPGDGVRGRNGIDIRRAVAADIAAMQEVERRAGMRFLEVGMPDVAFDEPPPESSLLSYVDGGRAWVAVEEERGVVGYALALVVDGQGHLEQLSVVPEHEGRGIGGRLIEEVRAWADGPVTLSTFVDVPWNAPYYERRGFRVLAEHELTPGLLAVRVHEAVEGLDVAARVFMRHD